MPESEPRLIRASEPAGPAEPQPRLIRTSEPAGPAETQPQLILGYLDVLAARLPASVADELAHGLAETYSARIALAVRLLRPVLAR